MAAHSGTAQYYAANAQAYFDNTSHLDMSASQQRLTQHLAPGAHILDAGCGSGRDSKAFLAQGFQVTAFDACRELAELASAYTGLQVKAMRFDQLEAREAFDGVYASASLLHLDEDQLLDAFNRLLRSLKPGGVLVAEFKYGTGVRIESGTDRMFNDLDETRAQRLAATCGARLLAISVTSDKLGRGNQWLALVCAKG